MAVEYHLLTAFGTGRTATMTIASPCVVTYANHGLSDGFKVVFATTGALPTGVTAGTTYYTKSTGANTFNLYTDAGLTTIVNTSGSQSGTHTIYSEYWHNLPATDPGNGGNYKGRYYSSAFMCFANMYDWEAALIANADPGKQIVLEIQGRWTDNSALRPPGAYAGYYSITIATRIRGVRDPDSFHGGVVGGGFRRVISSTSYTAIQVQKQPNFTLDGVEIVNSSATGGYGVRVYYAARCTIRDCLIKGYTGLQCLSYGGMFSNCILYDCANIGMLVPSGFGNGDVINNCLAVGCGTGFGCETGSTQASMFNCVAFGNTVNWGTAPTTALFLGLNNAGVAGDTPWGSSAITTVTSDAFTDFSNRNYTPASSGVLVNAGVAFTGLDPVDMMGDVRPNYESATYPNNLWDIGPYEYDHGEGLAPLSVPIAITGMVSGSEIAIYKASDMSAILAPQSTTGLYSGTYTYTGDTNIIVRVRKGTAAIRYLPYEYAGTITSTGFQLVVSQIPDTIAQ